MHLGDDLMAGPPQVRTWVLTPGGWQAVYSRALASRFVSNSSYDPVTRLLGRVCSGYKDKTLPIGEVVTGQQLCAVLINDLMMRRLEP